MDFEKLYRDRYSCRSFAPGEVGDKDLMEILEAGRMSPSARNLQPTAAIAVRSAEGLSWIDTACNRHGAPLAIVVCADVQASWERPCDGERSGTVDAAIAMAQMMYRAEELGYGTLWIGMFDPVKVSGAFGLEDRLTPVGILAVGRRADRTSANHGARKPMGEFVRHA